MVPFRSLLITNNLMALSEKDKRRDLKGTLVPFKIDPKDIKTYLLYNNSNYVSEVKVK
jgi:hypothetical protein